MESIIQTLKGRDGGRKCQKVAKTFTTQMLPPPPPPNKKTKQKNNRIKPKQAGGESLGPEGGKVVRGPAGGQGGERSEVAGSHTYTPSGLRLDTRGF